MIDKQKAGTRNQTFIFAAFGIIPSLLTIASVKPTIIIDFDGKDVSCHTLLSWHESAPPDNAPALGDLKP